MIMLVTGVDLLLGQRRPLDGPPRTLSWHHLPSVLCHNCLRVSTIMTWRCRWGVQMQWGVLYMHVWFLAEHDLVKRNQPLEVVGVQTWLKVRVVVACIKSKEELGVRQARLLTVTSSRRLVIFSSWGRTCLPRYSSHVHLWILDRYSTVHFYN
jgi:hypothetical protein